MPDHDPRALYRRLIAAVAANDVTALEEVVDPEITDHNPVPGQVPGIQGIKFWMAGIHVSFPDLAVRIDDTVAEADKVAGRVIWSGTQHGALMGIPATGKSVEFTAMHVLRFDRGRAVEWWGTADLLGMLTQLGARLQPPEPGP